MRGLRRRHGRSDSTRWSANSRAWWSRAEKLAPRELAAYRAARGKPSGTLALKRLKEKLS